MDNNKRYISNASIGTTIRFIDGEVRKFDEDRQTIKNNINSKTKIESKHLPHTSGQVCLGFRRPRFRFHLYDLGTL